MPITIDEVLRAAVIDEAVPATLRSVAPFLEEAQSILRYHTFNVLQVFMILSHFLTLIAHLNNHNLINNELTFSFWCFCSILNCQHLSHFAEQISTHLDRTEPDAHRAHVAIYCIDHGFELVDRFNLQLDDVGQATVKQFAEVRANLLQLYPYHDGADHIMHMPDGTKRPGVRINPEVR